VAAGKLLNVEIMTLRSSKTKGLLMLCGSLLFVAAGIWMIRRGEMFGWASVIFFGLCALISMVTMLPNASYLRLNREGFTQVILFRTSTVRWQDVSEFSVGRVGLNKMVMIDFSPNWHESSFKLKNVARSMSGHDGALSDTYGLSAEELVTLLKEWKNKSQS
jgi:hypothetical protein